MRDEVSNANQAIIDIRSIKSTLNDNKDEHKSKASFENYNDISEQLIEKLEVIENNIHMTKNQSYQDPLNYGIRINNRLAFLMQDQQRGDYPPTQQAEEFRISVTEELNEELSTLNSLISRTLPRLNQIGKSIGIEELVSDRVIRPNRP